MTERLESVHPQVAAQQNYDMIVVGAGIVGCGLAYGLGQSGRRVLLIERDLSVPDRIVGELLQPSGCASLQKLGMLDCLEGIDARVCKGYQVYWGSRDVPIAYPSWTAEKQVSFKENGQSGKDTISPDFDGQAEGRSFHHGYFVNALRKKAITCPNVTLIEGTASDLLQDAQNDSHILGIKFTPSSKAIYSSSSSQSLSPGVMEFKAPLTLIADGYASKYRRLVLPADAPAPVVRSNFVALLLKDAALPSPGYGHVILTDEKAVPQPETETDTIGGPVLVYQLSEHDTRMLVDVPGEKLPSIGKGELQAHLRRHVLPCLPKSLVPSFESALSPESLASSEGRLRSMPNSVLPAYPQHSIPLTAGCLLVGDALNMRHPLTGGGMTVGLNDACILTELLGGQAKNAIELCDQESATQEEIEWMQSQVKDAAELWFWRRKGLSSCVNVLAQALYSLFGANNEDLEVLKMGCFKYLNLGGECANGPVSLLSGLKPSQKLLFYHFFSVAFYSIYVLFTMPLSGQKSAPGPLEWPGLVLRSASVFWTACVVLLPVIYREAF